MKTAGKWMALEEITLSEETQTQQDKQACSLSSIAPSSKSSDR